MLGSGTIKTLAALVGAMAVGTAVLIAMETAPARPVVPIPLRLRGDDTSIDGNLVRSTRSPLLYQKWRNIVIHDIGRDGADATRGCHFLISRSDSPSDGSIRPTNLWLDQQNGDHIYMPGFSYNENSIGICLVADTSRSGPSSQQMKALVRLVSTLQASCQIPRDRVYLHSDLGEDGCPGQFFPKDEFREELLRPAR
jgi:hypothetical protein